MAPALFCVHYDDIHLAVNTIPPIFLNFFQYISTLFTHMEPFHLAENSVNWKQAHET